MPRKPNTKVYDGRTANTRYGCWFSKNDLEALQKIANDLGRSRNEVVRCLVRQAAAQPKVAQKALSYRD